MRIENSVRLAAIALLAMCCLPLGVAAAGSDVAGSGAPSLLVQPHPGAEAIDVTGRGIADRALTLTLVSTFDRDLPDVVLSRTNVVPRADGTFSAVISIAAGFTRGSIITVYATSTGGGPAASARYLTDAPNRGVAIPLDEVPRSVR